MTNWVDRWVRFVPYVLVFGAVGLLSDLLMFVLKSIAQKSISGQCGELALRPSSKKSERRQSWFLEGGIQFAWEASAYPWESCEFPWVSSGNPRETPVRNRDIKCVQVIDIT